MKKLLKRVGIPVVIVIILVVLFGLIGVSNAIPKYNAKAISKNKQLVEMRKQNVILERIAVAAETIAETQK